MQCCSWFAHLFLCLCEHRVDLLAAGHSHQVNLHVRIARAENVLFRQRLAFDHANAYLTRADVGGLQVWKKNGGDFSAVKSQLKHTHDNYVHR